MTIAPESLGKHGDPGLKMSFVGGNLEFGCPRLSVGKCSLDRIAGRRRAKTVGIVTVSFNPRRNRARRSVTIDFAATFVNTDHRKRKPVMQLAGELFLYFSRR